MTVNAYLKLFSEASLGDAELVPVLCDSPSCYLVPLLIHDCDKFVISKRLLLVLIVHAFLQDLLEFPGGNLFTLLILKTFREEIFEREYSEMSLDILAVHNSGNVDMSKPVLAAMSFRTIGLR